MDKRTAGDVMLSAYNLCPNDIQGQPARMRWIAEYFLAHYPLQPASALSDEQIEKIAHLVAMNRSGTESPNDCIKAGIHAALENVAHSAPTPAQEPRHDAISRSKRILEAVDTYHERPDDGNRHALRSMLLDEFTASQPAPDAVAYEAQADEDAAVIHKLATVLAGVALALKGPEAPMCRHGYHNLPDLASKLMLEVELYRANAVQPAPDARADWIAACAKVCDGIERAKWESFGKGTLKSGSAAECAIALRALIGTPGSEGK